MSRRRSRKFSHPVTAVATNLMLAPAVMLARLPLLAGEARHGDRWPSETARAVAEKAAAAAEGAAAAQLSLAKAAWSFWPDVIAGRVPALVNGEALREAADAALKPAGKRVRANFRRLSRRA